jgi:outer membrane protein
VLLGRTTWRSETQKTAIDQQLAQAKRNFEVGTATIVDTLEAQARYDQSVAKETPTRTTWRPSGALQVLLGKLLPYLAPCAIRSSWRHRSPTTSRRGCALPKIRASPSPGQGELRFLLRRGFASAPATCRPDLSGNYTYTDNPRTPRRVSSVLSTAPRLAWCSIPLYSGGLVQSRVREALANRTKAEQDLENTRRTVAQNVRVSFLNVTSGIALVRALEQASPPPRASSIRPSSAATWACARAWTLNAQQSVFQSRRDLQQRATTTCSRCCA